MTLQDGVYIGLEDETYFADDRLGSTDLAKLHKDPASWWYSSRHNPHRGERERTDEMEFGSALHALLLEGEAVYTAKTVIKPETYIDPKTGEEKKWNGNAAVCKQWAEENERPGRIILKESADRRVRHMAALIQHHPEIGPPMREGMSEVSILWTHESGLRMRARFDKLLPRFTIDLKTFGGDARGLNIRQQCTGIIAQRHYDVQRYIYDVARLRMRELIEDGKLFGGSAEQKAWIQRVAAVEDWSWCWVFYRRRDDEKGFAPMVQPIIRPSLDMTFDTGRQKVEVALANYRAMVARWGLDTPWAVIEPVWEPLEHDFPTWIKDVNTPTEAPELGAAA